MTRSKYTVTLAFLLAVLGLLIASSLLSTMIAFMGGSGDASFQLLTTLQHYGIGFSAALTLLSILVFATFRGVTPGLQVAWQHVPGWLLFGAGMLIFLALLGELSYFLMRNSTLLDAEWVNHAALLCLIAASIAACFVYAVIHAASGAAPYVRARW
ncbi:MAG: hypothetical protein AAF660_06990 [Pseudomonadota bacterium]